MVLEQGIHEGVRMGLFGLGELENNKPNCRYFKELPTVAFAGNEIIINEALCHDQKKQVETPVQKTSSYTQPETGETPGHTEVFKEKDVILYTKAREKIQLRFSVPKGKVSSIMGVINLLQTKFETLQIELSAANGNMPEQEYEDKIKETFRQMGIEIEEQ